MCPHSGRYGELQSHVVVPFQSIHKAPPQAKLDDYDSGGEGADDDDGDDGKCDQYHCPPHERSSSRSQSRGATVACCNTVACCWRAVGKNAAGQ